MIKQNNMYKYIINTTFHQKYEEPDYIDYIIIQSKTKLDKQTIKNMLVKADNILEENSIEFKKDFNWVSNDKSKPFSYLKNGKNVSTLILMLRELTDWEIDYLDLDVEWYKN